LEAFDFESSKHFDKAKIKDGVSKIEKFFMIALLKKETNNNLKQPNLT